jgi:flagellar biosynthesis/type III secretory pathway chaperone
VQEALDKAEEVIEELVKEKEKLLNKLTSLERQLAEQDQSMLGEVYVCVSGV